MMEREMEERSPRNYERAAELRDAIRLLKREGLKKQYLTEAWPAGTFPINLSIGPQPDPGPAEFAAGLRH